LVTSLLYVSRTADNQSDPPQEGATQMKIKTNTKAGSAVWGG